MVERYLLVEIFLIGRDFEMQSSNYVVRGVVRS